MPYLGALSLKDNFKQAEEQKNVEPALDDQAVGDADLALINELISQCTAEPSEKGIRDEFLEQMPQQDAGLYDHLMQALAD